MGKIVDYLKKRPGLIVILMILVVITAVNIKPDFYLAGWDNYSSYFNLKTNIFRTFFATWREYRGLGVPSDSESTDIFRQIFFLILSPFVKTQLLDQIYAVFALNFGVLLVYFLPGKLLGYIKKDSEHKDIVGFAAGFFYLFNLNTLATFYFPMIMFINRYYTVPLLVTLLLRYFENKKLSSWEYFLFGASIVATAGSYMTATVFITVLMFLSVFIFFQSPNIKKSLISMTMFLLLNGFWLFPFINYTIQRSGVVNLAPTFIEANEIQLNKPKSFYTLEKLAILYPNFFDTAITSIDRQNETGYHPLVPIMSKFPYRHILWLFPLLYIAGSIYITVRIRRNWRIMWIPATVFLFMFLSMKEFSPLGFVYIFLEKAIPFFGNIFRFADTKFHFYIAFSGSLAIGLFTGLLAEKIKSKSLRIFPLILIILSAFVFKGYFTGNLFGFFDRNRIPDAYFKLAEVVNSDHGDGRVLHLPFDKNIYWRSYNWGYLGSSFLHFMIDKPLIEKTFEPGSQENALLNDEIFRIIANTQSATANHSQESKTFEFYNLLKKTGIKYIIFDETVSSEQPSKGITLWGRFNVSDSNKMIGNLENAGYLNLRASFPVNLTEFMTDEKVFPEDPLQISEVEKSPLYSIKLYEVKEPDAKIRTAGKTVVSDSNMSSLSIQEGFDYMQDDSGVNVMTSPFKRRNTLPKIEKGFGRLVLDGYKIIPGLGYDLTLQNKAGQPSQTQIGVFVRKDEDNLTISFYQMDFPDVVVDGSIISNRKKIKEISIPLGTVSTALEINDSTGRYLANWQILPYDRINGLRIKMGKTTMPLPSSIGETEGYVGSTVVDEGVMPIKILAQDTETKDVVNSFGLTEKPNCFDDGLKDYASSLSAQETGFSLDSMNGSTCLISSLGEYVDEDNNYLEVGFEYNSSSEDLDGDYDLKYANPSKPILRKTIVTEEKPNYFYACIRDVKLDDCFNVHSTANLGDSGSVIIPAEKEINALNPIIFLALKNIGYQKQNLIIHGLEIKEYKTVASDDLTIVPAKTENMSIISNTSQPLELIFDLPLSGYSFYQNSMDGFNVSNGPCSRIDSYRTFRKDKKENLISYFENCDNSLFQTLDFNSNNFYLWSVDYNSASGKYPRMVLGDGLFNYVDQYLSLWHGYPNVKGFKEFQYPEFFQSTNSVKEKLDNVELVNTSITIPSNPEFYDYKKKNFTISHNSENEGMALINRFNVIAIPNTWEGLTINSPGNITVNEFASVTEYKQFLPSLWKLILNNDDFGNQVVYFNEAYDSQWGIYSSIFDLMTGKESSMSHYKCNGYANCFEVSQPGTYYVFYQPERLYFFGWLVTLAAIFLGKIIVSI
ncbi:MAG: hypothetical protein ACOYUB_00685 [Patescibacteria group bacterium]